ncbi:alpha-2-macroglobulin family protein [Adhaeribacter sp. BT258]|uniref:Alpha-2-macroglobulin family protein n=1 Tax=Adhaeribacter terrigena TaxID=2793070 RepID=A0ABS1BZJ7_9BACT|nr:alpha-2-macroglobulin [Adhaeribacter terrigena]MBK0402549.1 alpha-2-macroglobulin family protein [Adhaeribacter terrigena]
MFLIFSVSCSKLSNTLEVESRNFDEEIAQYQNLVFRFNKDVVGDSLLNRWDSTAYISFKPAVKGKFRWSNSRELTFSPFEPFAPSTKYVAKLQPALANLSKDKPKLNAEDSIVFHTPLLSLTGTQVYWTMSARQANSVDIRVNVNFNYPVKPTDVDRLAHIFVDGKEVKKELATSETGQTVGFIINALPENQAESVPLKIVIDKGLQPVGGNWKTPENLTLQSEIPPKGVFQVAEISGSFVEGEGVMNVFMNQPVQAEKLESFISISPTVPVTVEAHDNGFEVRGKFRSGENYQIVISKELKSMFGITLGKEHSQYVSFGELQPSVSFVNTKAFYLGAAGNRNLAVNLVDVPKVKVTIARVYANNVHAFMRTGEEYGYDYQSEEDYQPNADGEYVDRSYQYYNTADFGDVVSTRTYETKNLPKNGNQTLLNLSLADLDYNSEFKGIYVVQIRDTERQYLQASKIISVSDIGLIARQGADEVLVFANSIKSTAALPGIKVNFISTNNQVVQSVTTDKNGVAKFTGSPLNKHFKIGMVSAQKGQDFNFMILERNRVETSRFEVGGLRSNPAQYDAFIYGDRDIYRPGDTVHVNTILRTQDWKTLANIPVKIKLLLPTGREYKAYRQTLNSQGAFQSDFYLPPASMTGQYTIEVYSGNDVLLNSKKISVEEFIPDRIKVDLKLQKPDVKPGETQTASITATNLFGPPAVGRKAEFDFSLKRKTFSPQKYTDYNFNLEGANNITFQNELKTAETNEAGFATQEYQVPDYKDLGVLEGKVFSTVFDETGRPVNRLKTFEVPTQTAFFGIKSFNSWVNTRQVLPMHLIALNKAGKPLQNATANVQIIRKVWETVVQGREGGRYGYNSQMREQVVTSRDIAISGSGTTFNFNPLNSGEYEIRVRRPGAETYVAQHFYAYGYGDTQSNSFEVNNEGEVTIEFDKAEYQVGEKANILFKSPFAGKILVTVERNKVYEHYYLPTDKKSASLNLEIKDAFLPNVYITATAIRQMTANSGLPLTVARGFKPLLVAKASTKLAVNISAPVQSRSQKTQTINVKTTPNAEVTLAVVDEGILQLKNYETPDPFKFFYQKRALEVNPFDLYPYLFPELSGKRSSSGGDGYDLSKRVNPLTSKRVKLVTFWSGKLTANANGEVSYKVPIPQFSGALRVMAVAYKYNAFGASEKFIKVADPVVISTALPRFLSPGDTVSVPVTLSNTTSKPTSATAKLQLSGPLQASGNTSQTVQIKPNSEKQVTFKVYSKNSIGNGSVLVMVNALNETFREKTDISVRPPASLQKVSGNGMVAAGKSQDISFKTDFMPGSASARLIVSKSPMVQFAGDLRYLIQYPYGCVEQTISAAFPQIYYADLAKSLRQDKKATRYNPDYNVQEAIRKLETMQLYNGGMAYWPGTDMENWWSTAYAAHFLLEAQRAGFQVNAKMLNKMFEYLQMKLKTRETERYTFYDEKGKEHTKTIAKKEIFYSLYVLAVVNKYDVTAMNYYKANPGLLAIDSKYLLASAFAMYGNNRNFLALLPKSFSGENSKRELWGSFYSAIRDEALALNALLTAQPNHPAIGEMARHLSQQLKSERWLNTQERAFALLALGKLSKANANQNITATVTANGKQIGSFKADELVLTQNLTNQNLTIKTSGSGSLYYFWEQEGISPTGAYKEEDNYLKVRKHFYDRNGREITGNTFNLNDLIVVKLTLQASDFSTSVENVAITDILPAGFEIENPRIGAVPEMAWVKDAATPDYFDIRDDRINLFTTATSSPKNFYYLVRAVSKGQYKMGPVSADAMYNAEYHSYWGSGVVVVK